MRGFNRFAYGSSIAALLTLTVAGCGGLSTLSRIIPGGHNGGDSPLIGRFLTTQLQVNGASTACPGSLPNGSGGTVACTADFTTFNNDGTVQVVSGTNTTTGTWFLSTTGNIYTVSVGGVVQVGTITFSPDNSTFVFAYTGASKVFARQ